MSDKSEEKKAGSENQSKNVTNSNETEPTLSKSQKKRAKKQQKKNSESADEKRSSSKSESEEKPSTDESKEEKSKEEELTVELPKKKQQIVPMIRKFDENGKALRTIAGNGQVFLGEITPHNIMQLKRLNEAVFPIAYNDKFYVEARTCGDLGRLAYYNDVVVGAVCCRIDDISDEKALYLMTLGTLAAYRQCGIGTVLIDYALKLCKKMEEIKTMYLHVQVNNQNAVHFYEKHGFTNDGIIEDYYRISPRDAYLLIKRIRY
uniref:N-terminal methionine N(alpha)-acetyltransferase NatE n=1 Tax=Caenorhabditis tropicalis TaxID=1561998 RepID=A0A1I7UAH1_9PELO